MPVTKALHCGLSTESRAKQALETFQKTCATRRQSILNALGNLKTTVERCERDVCETYDRMFQNGEKALRVQLEAAQVLTRQLHISTKFDGFSGALASATHVPVQCADQVQPAFDVEGIQILEKIVKEMAQCLSIKWEEDQQCFPLDSPTKLQVSNVLDNIDKYVSRVKQIMACFLIQRAIHVPGRRKFQSVCLASLQLKHSHVQFNYNQRIAISNDGTMMAICLKNARNIALYSLLDNDVITTFKATSKNFGAITDMHFSGDGKAIVVFDSWNVDLQEVTLTGEHVRFIGKEVLSRGLSGMDVNTRAIIATVASEGLVHVFDWKSGLHLRTINVIAGLTNAQAHHFTFAKFMPDGTSFVVVDYVSSKMLIFTLSGEALEKFTTGFGLNPMSVGIFKCGDMIIEARDKSLAESRLYQRHASVLSVMQLAKVKFSVVGNLLFVLNQGGDQLNVLW